jgi:DNA-binding CsgD family transcriptional regulator
MSYTQPRWSRTQVEFLMDIASSLADLTGTPTTATHIAPYLSKAFDLECISVAVIGDAGEPAIRLQSASGPLADDPAALNQNLLAIYQQTKPLTTSDAPALRLGSEEEEPASEMSVQRLATYPKATVLARTLDAQHRMLLVIHHATEETTLTADVADMLQLVADELAKLLGALISWRERLESVGEPFDRLTDREWMVLQGLMTEAGEKQLADQLGLSPHTLHSHIKSIYRKVEVQGRLPLLSKVQSAMRARRQAHLSCPTEPAGATLAKAVVAG